MKAFLALLVVCAACVIGAAYLKWNEQQSGRIPPAPASPAPKPAASATEATPATAPGQPKETPTQPTTESVPERTTSPASQPAPPTAGGTAAPQIAPPSTPPADERLLLVAVEGRKPGSLTFERSGSASFSRLGGRPVLLLSGAAVHGLDAVRFVLADGSQIPAGRFAGVEGRDLLVMEAPSGNWPFLQWPEQGDTVVRGQRLKVRWITFESGRPVPHEESPVVLSLEPSLMFVEEGSAPPGALALDEAGTLVGVVSLDPRRAVKGPTESREQTRDRLVITRLSGADGAKLQWHTKSFESLALTSERIAAMPRRSLILTQLIGGYPSIGALVEEPEFYLLTREFLARYSASATNPGFLIGAQLDYGRQLDGKLSSDIDRALNDSPIAYQRWLIEEVRSAREPLRKELLTKRRAIELSEALNQR